MDRETPGVPYIFGHGRTDDRYFPEIVGIAAAGLPYYGSPRANVLSETGHAMRAMRIDLAVRRTGLPERWLERLRLKVVEANGRVSLETAPCRILVERVGSDGYVHLLIASYPIPIRPLAFDTDAELQLLSPSGHTWKGLLSSLLRAA